MARPGIPYETVRSFIDGHVADAGALPSIAAIVGACGGSATTITRFRRRYVEETQGFASDVPDALETSIAAGARTLWKELVDALAAREGQLDAAFEARMQEATETVEKATKQTLTAQQEARETRAALDETRAAFAEERSTGAALRDRLTASESALAKANGAIDALETRVAEGAATVDRAAREAEERLAAAREETARLERQTDARIAAVEAAQEQALAEQNARAVRLQKMLEEAQAALSNERQAVAEARERRTESEQHNAALRAQVEGHVERVVALTAGSERYAGELQDARDRLEWTVAELAGARASIQGLEAAVDAARQDAGVRERDLEELRRANGRLVDALARLTDE